MTILRLIDGSDEVTDEKVLQILVQASKRWQKRAWAGKSLNDPRGPRLPKNSGQTAAFPLPHCRISGIIAE